jgi:hypothetical protein
MLLEGESKRNYLEAHLKNGDIVLENDVIVANIHISLREELTA